MSAMYSIAFDFDEHTKMNEAAVPAFKEFVFFLAYGRYEQWIIKYHKK